MPVFLAAIPPILTAVGRVTLPVLAKEFAKRGGTQFIKTYGKAAFQAVTGGTAGAVAYDQINKSVPVTTGLGDYIGDTGQKEKERERIAEENKERMKGSPAPVIKTWEEAYPDQSGEIVDSSPPPSIPEPIEVPQETFPDLSDKLNKPIVYKKDDSEFKYPTTEELEGHIKDENKFWEEKVIPRANEEKPKLNIKNLPKIVEADKHFGAAAMSFSNFSESQLIYMSPQEYLDLTKRFRPEKQGTASKLNSNNIEKVLKDGKELANIPFLNVKKVGDSYEVTGQEGIHRAIAFKNSGYDKIPVVIEGTGTDKVAGVENKVYTATPKSYLYTEPWAKDYIGFIPKSIKSDGKVLLTKPEDFYNVRTKEKLFDKDSIAKQTDKLVPEKVELGPLSAADKQTAIALKGDKPDFYSRAVEAITNAKQDKSTKGKWKSIIQSNSTKTEMEYLGLTELLSGNESITKQELLDFVDIKNIASSMTVRVVPKDQMNPLFEEYSLGLEKEGTQEHVVYQIGKDKDYQLLSDQGGLYKEPHFDTEYGTGTFAHARTQVGYGDKDAPLFDEPDVYELLKNTQIVEEIQSKQIQRIQEEGVAKDWIVLKGSDITEEFVNKNYKGTHELREVTGSNHLEAAKGSVMYIWDETLEKMVPYRRLNHDIYYTFSKDKLRSTSANSVEEAKRNMLTWDEAVQDFPIKETKVFVELVLRDRLRKAILDGRDGIAITNGQIQYNRYPAMKEKKRLGLKKAYDTIHYDQLNKIAKEFNIDLKRITISEGSKMAPQELQDIHLDNQIKRAQDQGATLQKITLQELWDRTKDTAIPDHATLYGDVGRGQGTTYIEHYLTQYQLDEEGWEKIKNNEVYVWKKPARGADAMASGATKKIVWDMPLVPVKNTSNLEGDNDLGRYETYLKNWRPAKGIDQSYKQDPEQLIRMDIDKIPKELKRKIIREPIKFSKLETQGTTATA